MEQKRSITVHGDECSFPDQCNKENLSQGAEKDAEVPNSKAKRNKKSVKSINQDGDDTDVPVIPSFDGEEKKNKSKKSYSVFSALSLDALDVEEDEVEIASNKHMDDEKKDESVELDFDFGKKKKSKKKKDVKSAAELENKNDDDRSEISHAADISDSVQNEKDVSFDFGRKKRLNKKKKSEKHPQEEEDLDKLLAELGESIKAEEKAPVDEEPKENEMELKSRKKKKKTKSGRTVEEEDDLDKLLAELGGPMPSSYSGLQQSSYTAAQPAEIVEADKEPDTNHTVETAAAKKKKKKKEKEKEKKVAAKKEEADEVKVEAVAKGKTIDNKKIPKHVREKQEALARRKDEEERRKKEEEERLRNEEEERRRLEELERIAEETRRRKKEKEKEKLLKKKQEGKLLTGKQKEEQSRLEAMRNQFLNQNNGVRGDAPNQVKKKPKYETKKSKLKNVMNNESKGSQQEIETEMEQVSEEINNTVDEVNEVEVKLEERNQEKVEAIENEEDGGEWDAIEIILPTTSPFAEDDKYEKEEAQLNLSKKSIGSNDTAQKHAAPMMSANKFKKPQEAKKIEVDSRKADVKASDDKSNATSRHELRSPICCILGHVDTGKTKLLDCIRRTNVQEGKAGGITQQIGATYFPIENIRDRTKKLKADATLKVPGLLVIDTPGHESFANFRSRGSSLCDIAVLVVDIMHGLEPQTIESLNLLKNQNTEFIVALNKVDRLYEWKPHPNAPIIKTMGKQSENVKKEFDMRLVQIVTQFKEQGLNTALYYQNKRMGETFNIVPTSAISGEGIPDLLLLLIQRAQKTMEDKLTYQDEVECTVLEVKVIEGLGTTIDVVLVNGILHKGDRIVVCGMQGPIVTNVRDLLTPQPMKELRVKGAYQHHTEIKAAQWIKISA